MVIDTQNNNNECTKDMNENGQYNYVTLCLTNTRLPLMNMKKNNFCLNNFITLLQTITSSSFYLYTID